MPVASSCGLDSLERPIQDFSLAPRTFSHGLALTFSSMMMISKRRTRRKRRRRKRKRRKRKRKMVWKEAKLVVGQEWEEVKWK